MDRAPGTQVSGLSEGQGPRPGSRTHGLGGRGEVTEHLGRDRLTTRFKTSLVGSWISEDLGEGQQNWSGGAGGLLNVVKGLNSVCPGHRDPKWP